MIFDGACPMFAKLSWGFSHRVVTPGYDFRRSEAERPAFLSCLGVSPTSLLVGVWSFYIWRVRLRRTDESSPVGQCCARWATSTTDRELSPTVDRYVVQVRGSGAAATHTVDLEVRE